MSITIKKRFHENLTFEKLLEAHYRASKHKRNKKEILEYEMDLETNLVNLESNIRGGNYQLGKYRVFVVYEPKERVIKSLPYVDRIVHQWYIEEFIKPFILPRFILDTYACIPNRGTHKAVDKLQRFMRKKKRENSHYYILKCDIRKFFDSIDKYVLYEIIKKYMKEKELYEFTKKLIFDQSGEKGIPIGNYTSQYFANIYLNELDQFIKNQLRLEYYVRYMDDFILLLDSKEEAKRCKENINTFLNQYLKLELNAKSRYYPNAMGIDFCGYRIFPTHRLIRTRSKTKMKRIICKWKRLQQEGKWNQTMTRASYQSWLGHAKHANCYRLTKKMSFLFFSLNG